MFSQMKRQEWRLAIQEREEVFVGGEEKDFSFHACV